MSIISLMDQDNVCMVNAILALDTTHFVIASKIETLITNSFADLGIGELCGAPLDHRNICKLSSRLIGHFQTTKLFY
jgi:hypothetical protein